MNIYFTPLRRKLGVLTLLLACMLMAGWIRSNTICDGVALNFFGNKYTVRSYQHQILWDHEHVNYGKLNDPFFTCFSVNIAELSVSDAHPMFGFTEENRKLAANFVPTPRPSVRLSLVISQLPYWSIVIPLTALSAWLLLSKPRTDDNRSIVQDGRLMGQKYEALEAQMYYRINDDLFRDRFEDDEPAAAGDRVVVINGPFCSFEGTVIEIDDLQSLALVAISPFGPESRVTINLEDIKKSSH